MSKIKQNLVVLMEPSEDAWRIHLKVGNMIFNRFCIDEDAAFELSGVYYLKSHNWNNFDANTTCSALRKISETEAKELQTHIIYAGDFFGTNRLKSLVQKEMKKNRIKSAMVTSYDLWRMNLITKGAMEGYCMEEESDSVNDDLESLFEDLRLGKERREIDVRTYFLPQLTEEELQLVEQKDKSYFESFLHINPDVPETEMMLSESDSKYVYGVGRRSTFTIKNSSESSSEIFYDSSIENSSDNLSETSSETSSENSKLCFCFRNFSLNSILRFLRSAFKFQPGSVEPMTS